MQSYKDLSNHFGTNLYDPSFNSFLHANFSDLTEYNVAESDYVISEEKGIELGFINEDAEFDEDEELVFNEGSPMFAFFNINPTEQNFFKELPFNIDFNDKREIVLEKAGNPTQTNQGRSDLLEKDFLVDHYKLDNLVITFDYDPISQALNFMQVRDNNLMEHLKL